MLWLINPATAGQISGQVPAAPAADKKDDKKDGPLSATGGASFSDFKIDASA
jgi:hypothetical protein